MMLGVHVFLPFWVHFQPDCLDDLAHAITYAVTKLAYQVSEDDVTRARNQVKDPSFAAFSG